MANDTNQGQQGQGQQGSGQQDQQKMGQQSGQQSSGRSGTQAMLQALPRVSGAWGSGHLLQGTLFSVLVTDAGQVAVGAVPPQLLYRALAAR